MTIKRILMGFALLLFLGGAAFFAQEAKGPGNQMTRAARAFVKELDADQKKQAVFDFKSPERLRWFFTPQQAKGKPTRKGLPLEGMNATQKKAALELVKAGTSMAGYDKAATIMSLESLLRKLEKGGKGPVRNPEWYFLTVFGSPGKGEWGWRFEGHHLSLNFTLLGDKVTASTPQVYGANPATVKAGEKKGLRTLPETEVPVRALLALLDAGQKKAVLLSKRFPEIGEGKPNPNPGKATGLAAAKMNEKQKALLRRLIEGYLARMPAGVAQAEWRRIEGAGLDKIYFALGGGDGSPDKPYTYRVQGPTFVIEFLNTQADGAGNAANHIHSGYRRILGDFDRD